MEGEEILKNTKTETSTLNVRELFSKYVRYVPLYIIAVALALFAAFAYLRYATEFYRASGSIVIKDDKSGPSSGNKIDELIQQDSRKNVQTEIEVMQSRPVMERVVRALNLNFTYTAVGKIKELDVYGMVPFKMEALQITDSSGPVEFSLHFLNEQNFQVNGAKEPLTYNQPFTTSRGRFRLLKTKKEGPGSDYKVGWYPTPARASGLLGGLTVVPKPNTGIVNLNFETTNPHLAADVVNQLMREYQAVTIEDKNAITLQKLQFIDARLDSVSKEVDSIQNLYVAFRQRNNIIDPATQSESYLRRIEEAGAELSRQQVQVQTVNQIEDYLRQHSNDDLAVPTSLSIEDKTLGSLVAEYNRAQMERAELRKNAPDKNVVVQQKTSEVASLRQKILETTPSIRKAFGTVIGSLQSRAGEALSQVSTVPAKDREALDLKRSLESKGLIFNTLLSRRDEAAITLAATISNTKILQDAQPDGTPIKPDRRGTKILAIVIGLLIPTIVIVLIELLNDKVSSRADIERLTQATILGEVGHNHSKSTLLVTSGNRKVIAEQFRILRSNLQYFLTHVERPVILITSSFSGEGKSFISTNMGAVMALANKKTIVLEFDIRKPKVMAQLNMGKRPGLTNYLLGQAKAEELPVAVPSHPNLFVLPCGPIPPNPSELLLDPKLDELLTYLKQNFEVIVMDTAPVGMVSDALTLSKYADCTLYIVRQGHTYKKQVTLVEEYYRESKLPKLSVVMNDVKVRAGYGAYGYGGYGYGYGYGEGYFEEEERPQGLAKWFGWLGFKNGVEKKSKNKKVKA